LVTIYPAAAQVEVFHAWESAETGELVAVAAELGSNQVSGPNHDAFGDVGTNIFGSLGGT
jgi:hypothetical protein